MFEKNFVKFNIHDFSYADPMHYATINKSVMISPRRFETTNPGIIATLTQRNKKRIAL
jgi:hypothetical protein